MDNEILNQYKSKHEIGKAERPLGFFILVPELVFIGGNLIGLVFNHTRRDGGFDVIFIIFLIIHTLVIYFLGGLNENRINSKEREYELALERVKEKKLYKDLEKLNRFEMGRNPDEWQQFLKEAKELNKTFECVESWRMEEERLK